jgi:hypothetical protein
MELLRVWGRVRIGLSSELGRVIAWDVSGGRKRKV